MHKQGLTLSEMQIEGGELKKVWKVLLNKEADRTLTHSPPSCPGECMYAPAPITIDIDIQVEIYGVLLSVFTALLLQANLQNTTHDIFATCTVVY